MKQEIFKLDKLEALIFSHFQHLVVVRDDDYEPDYKWLNENFGSEATPLYDTGWGFEKTSRWTESCSDSDGFRFRLTKDAVLFKLARG